MSDCMPRFCSLFQKIYFFSDIVSLILVIIYILKFKNNSQCFYDYLYNADNTPVYDIYLSDEMTKDTIKLGELEEYSNSNIKVQHKDIYVWKNKYINIKRWDNKYKIKNLYKTYYERLNPIPIDDIIVSKNNITGNTKYQSLKIDDNNFLYFSKDNDHLGRVIVDLKISFKEPRTYFLDDNYICFTPQCSKNNYKCTFNSKKIDSDSSKNLIKYNGINIEIINKFEYYEPSSYGLYIIYYNIGDTDAKNGIIFYYNLCLSFVIINISMRIIKLILFCIIDCVGGLGKFFSHLMMVIIHLINFFFCSYLK